MEAAREGREILVLEDVAAIAALYRTYGERRGHRVEVEEDGLRGLRRIEEGHFDAILLDLHLPGMSGLEILHSLERRGLLDRLIVVVVTAALSDALGADALAGARAVLEKPCHLAAIFDALEA
jgi:CheY-like chemotaxis protein